MCWTKRVSISTNKTQKNVGILHRVLLLRGRIIERDYNLKLGNTTARTAIIVNVIPDVCTSDYMNVVV